MLSYFQDLGLGQFCCPAKDNTTSPMCCNTDPNPPTTPKPLNSTSATPAPEAADLTRLLGLVFVSLQLLLARFL